MRRDASHLFACFIFSIWVVGAGGKAGPPPHLKNSKQTLEEQDDEPTQNENPDCEPEFISGEEDYMDSDFEGREGYRKGMSNAQELLVPWLSVIVASKSLRLPAVHIMSSNLVSLLACSKSC